MALISSREALSFRSESSALWYSNFCWSPAVSFASLFTVSAPPPLVLLPVHIGMASLLSFRQFTAIPQFTRSIVNRAALRPVPAPRGNIPGTCGSVASMNSYAYTTVTGDIATASDFLKAIGRSAETKVTVESWDELWKLNGPTLRKAGLGIRDRRCVSSTLHCVTCI